MRKDSDKLLLKATSIAYFFCAVRNDKIQFPNFPIETCRVAARRRDFVVDLCRQPELAISLDTAKRNLSEIAFLPYDS